YLAEFQYRFNRRFDLSVILVRLLRASSVTSPYPERLIRAAEHCG
ncbi:MAG: IS1595 family transposase, partial [Candidatus Gottesmanbacteria bacterium]|nr:IS1595 family transposase [Candidatus Gottesmanbacteria bacterium]